VAGFQQHLRAAASASDRARKGDGRSSALHRRAFWATMQDLRRSLDRALAQRIDHDPSKGRMSPVAGRRTESGSLLASALLFGGAWAAGGWLLAGAARGRAGRRC
jgi:hypothetical protein